MQVLRIILVGFLFSWFGLICMLGNLWFVPIVLLRLTRVQFFENLSRDMVYLAWKFFIFSTEFLGYLKYEFEDYEKLKNNQQKVIIANHPSLLDVVFILSKIRRINCVVKSELAKNIFLSPAIKASNYIVNTGNMNLLERALEALKKDNGLLIFPEGTRTKDRINFHKAPFYIAIHGAKALIPIFIYMNPKSLQKGVKWYKTPKVTIQYRIKIAQEIKIGEYLSNKPQSLRVRSLCATMNELYQKEIIC